MSVNKNIGWLGLIGGVIGGYSTRPTIFGTQVPLDIIFSNHPNDASLANDMLIHMGLWVGGGMIAGVVLTAILSKNSSSKSEE